MLTNVIKNRTIGFRSLMSCDSDVVLSKVEFQKLIAQNSLMENEDDNFVVDEIIEEGSDIVTAEEIAEYIVENPNEVVVQFPIISEVKLEEKLPFFRSVVYKLGGI